MLSTEEHPPGTERRPADWAAMDPDQVLAAVSGAPTGLTSAEAAARLEAVGPNSVHRGPVNAWRILLRQFRNAVLVLLAATTVLSALLGETSDAVIIGVILVASVGLGFGNEYRAELSTARLQATLPHSAVVLREGRPTTVDVGVLVPGDVVRLTLGSLVPADLRLLEARQLECDESVLTGESVPSPKSVAPTAGTDLGDLASLAFLGTVVHHGDGTGVVVATGARTELGRIAESLGSADPETAFQAGLRRFSRLLMGFGGVLVVSILVTGLLLHRSLLDSALFALAIAVGITPQLLPAVINTSLAAGSRRLAKQRVLVKRLVCIEDLGNIDVLVTDKTGTLTEGTIRFERSLGPDGEEDLRVASLAALMTPDAVGASSSTDALDSALVEAVSARSALPDGVRPLAVVPFDHERRRMSALLEVGGEGRVLVVKGAPEEVFASCGDVPAAAAATAAAALQRGVRLLAVATRPAPGATTCTAEDEHDLRLRGFLAFSDPPRLDARESLDRLGRLGVRLVIATGDHPAVAEEVARRVGVPDGSPVLGHDMDALDDRTLAARLATTTILARVSPEQKARVVRLLRGDGRTVGFLGDGVNDSLALHAADVGISVDTATDVAKDAADVVLLEKDLGVVATGVEEGRRIFANTIKYVLMAASSNLGNMISATAASAFLPFLPMLPGQILLGNLLYDAGQLTISTDRVDAAAVRAPAKWDLGEIRRFMLVFGALSSVFDLATFALLIGVFSAGAPEFHTGWFLEAMGTQALVVFVIRTRTVPFFRSRPSLALFVAALATVVVAWLLPLTPLAAPLGFRLLPLPLVLAIVALVVLYIVSADVAKLLFNAGERRRETRRPARPRRLHRVIAKYPLKRA